MARGFVVLAVCRKGCARRSHVTLVGIDPLGIFSHDEAVAGMAVYS